MGLQDICCDWLTGGWVGGGRALENCSRVFWYFRNIIINSAIALFAWPTTPGAEHINCDWLQVLTGGWGEGGTLLMHLGRNHFGGGLEAGGATLHNLDDLRCLHLFLSNQSLLCNCQQSSQTTHHWAVWGPERIYFFTQAHHIEALELTFLKAILDQLRACVCCETTVVTWPLFNVNSNFSSLTHFHFCLFWVQLRAVSFSHLQ